MEAIIDRWNAIICDLIVSTEDQDLRRLYTTWMV